MPRLSHPLLRLALTCCLLLLALPALASEDAASTQPWWETSVSVIIGVLALVASWVGVMVALFRFAMSLGQLTTKVEHVKESLDGFGMKLDAHAGALAKVDALEHRVSSQERELSTLRSTHGEVHSRVIHLEAVTVQQGARRHTGTQE